MELHLVDLLVVGLYLALCLFIGIVKSTKVRSLVEFASFRNITLPVLVCTLLSSSIGVGKTLVMVEKIYLFGLVYAIYLLCTPLYWLFSVYIIAPRIDQFKGCLTLSEIMYKLYGVSARWITTLVSILFILGSLGVQVAAMGYILHYFFNIDQLYGSFVGSLILAIYSVLGGMRAIIFSEVFKFTIFMLIIPASCIISMIEVGGIENIIAKLPQTHTSFYEAGDFWTIISVIIFAILPSYNPELVQRYLLANSAKQLKNAFTATFGFSLVISLSLVYISYFLAGSGYSSNSEDAMLHFINQYLPIGLKGLMIAGLMSIAMAKSESSASANSIIIVNDIFKQLFPKINDEVQIFLLRFFIIALIITSLIIASSAVSLIDILMFARNFWDPIIFIPLTAGFLGVRTNYLTFVCSTICAVVTTIVVASIVKEFGAISLCAGIVGSLIGFVFAHYSQILLGYISTEKNNELVWSKKSLTGIKFPNLTRKFQVATRAKAKYSELSIYAIVSTLVYCVYFLAGSSDPIIGVILLIGYVLTLLFIFREGLFPSGFAIKTQNIFGCLLLTYCMPFTAGCMLFFGDGDNFWLLSSVLAVFSLSFFVDSFRFFILNSLGISLAYLLLYFISEQGVSEVNLVYLVVFGVILLLLRNKETEEKIKQAKLEVLSGAIAHEVKNPLASINMSAQALKSILKNSKVKNNGDNVSVKLSTKEFHLLQELSEHLHDISISGVTTVNNILSDIRNNGVCTDSGIYKVSEVLNCALKEFDRYGCILEIQIVDDFSFVGSFVNVKQLLLNLLNNVKQHAGNNVEITITAKNNKLVFKDHGNGLSTEDTARIFNTFYTKSQNGTGIGLAFCKMVIEEMGGNIECHAELGKYTEFVITFA